MTGTAILIVGSSIIRNARLMQAISEIAEVVIAGQGSRLVNTVQNMAELRLVLLSSDKPLILENQLRLLKEYCPRVPVVFIGNRELLPTAFAFDVRDAFPNPINQKLLIERIEALLRGY
ncbi:MAG: hypothetical protein Q9P90_16940 [candidate division KSB1 bacterium]|nr:hypothetical protein [candidate division KSB1 bacterium]